jgi:hypothetical protein
MLEKSRFNRRLHNLDMLLNDLFHQLGMILKEMNGCGEYLLDSFPVALCDHIRIFNVKLIKSEEYRGYIASKKRYFYGVRVQLLTTRSGIPVEFVFMPGSAADVRALNSLPLNLPPGSQVYADSAYTDYQAEDYLMESSQIELKVLRKHNSTRSSINRGFDISNNPLVTTLKRYLVRLQILFLNQFMLSLIKAFYSKYKRLFWLLL